MTFVQVTSDQRGYETTLLLHAARPGERPRVLYSYRTAPGVRVGRRALDEDAIRLLEEQHPDIDFDWPLLIEEASVAAPEPERRPERRRKPARPREEAPPAPVPAASHAAPPVSPSPAALEAASTPDEREPTADDEPPPEPAPPVLSTWSSRSTPPNPLLEPLVGREIARRLRDRHAEIVSRIDALPDSPHKAGWQLRADMLDPDRWLTTEAILHGVQQAPSLFEELKRELA